MGTNYYLRTKDGVRKHIGKSSAGWCFSLHVLPPEGIYTLGDWEALWEQDGAEIQDEYGRLVCSGEMNRIITSRQWLGNKHWINPRRAADSEAGPNGLLRSRIDGTHCVGHGPGTWDYIAGNFS